MALEKATTESIFHNAEGKKIPIIMRFSKETISAGPSSLDIYENVRTCKAAHPEHPVRYVYGFVPESENLYTTSSYVFDFIIDDDCEPYFVVEVIPFFSYQAESFVAAIDEKAAFALALTLGAIPVGTPDLETVFFARRNGMSVSELQYVDFEKAKYHDWCLEYLTMHTQGVK